jgi:hypothetical protein
VSGGGGDQGCFGAAGVDVDSDAVPRLLLCSGPATHVVGSRLDRVGARGIGGRRALLALLVSLSHHKIARERIGPFTITLPDQRIRGVKLSTLMTPGRLSRTPQQ